MLARVYLIASLSAGACLSQCTDATLASGVFKPNVVAVDDTSVYFGDQNGTLFKVSKNGGAVTTLASNPGLSMAGIAVDSANVYYGVSQLSADAAYIIPGSGLIRAVPKTGGTSTTLASGLNAPLQVTQDAAAVYWTNLGSQDPSGIPHQDGSVFRVAKSGGAPQALASNLSAPVGLDIDDSYVYFGENFGTFPLPDGPHGLRKVPKAGGSVTQLYNATPGYAIAVDSSNVYFSGGWDLNVYGIPKTGATTAKTYASRQVFPDWVGVSGTQLFWVADGNCGPNGSLQMADLANNGAVTTLKGGMNCPYAGAIDDTAVFVPTKNGGTIEKICRPNVQTTPPPQPPPPPPPTNLPTISAGGVQNGASFQPGITANSWFTIKGTNLASVTDTWANAIVNGKLPAQLDGVKVSVGGQDAYVDYVSATQINAIAPNIGTGSISVTVTNANGTSTPATVNATAVGPAFFLWPNSYAVATHLDGSYAVKNGTFSGLTTVAAKPNDYVVLWGTGFGPTSPAAPAGTQVPSDQVYSTATPVTVTVGGIPATVYSDHAALAPTFAALFQLAVQIPANAPDGDLEVIATINGSQSPKGVLISVQH